MRYWKIKIFVITFLWLGLTRCNTDTIKDVDGNKYKTVTIGNQVWMKENLKTTRYNDGSEIPLVTDYDLWTELTTPAFCWYGNDSTNKEVYGALYNWYAVETKKLCPEGWHVPADSEWVKLKDFLGESGIAGDKLKEAGIAHWKSPNSEATNESGFSALPGGFRSFNGAFNYIWIAGYWWSSTEYTGTNVYFWNLRYKFSYLYKYIADKPNGFSVRCLKD